MSDRVEFTCNGKPIAIDGATGESLLVVLRERLGLVAAKDGCAPQGQCGCCTVLVDGEPRVACVTPVSRVAGRAVTTIEGLDEATRDALAGAFLSTGGSQCGFCTPGIVMRAASLLARGRTRRVDLDRALGAHLCRCTGWLTVYDAIEAAAAERGSVSGRDLYAASRRAELEGGRAQRVELGVPLGRGGFADDLAPRDALVAVPRPPGSEAPAVEAAGVDWVVSGTLVEARAQGGKVQGRRSTIDEPAPLPLPDRPAGGVRLATSWVEPAYLEPDASWCAPGGEPSGPLANGGAFGGKETSPAPAAARELADRYGRTVRVLMAREDVVRLGPKRPPIAAAAVFTDGSVLVAGVVAAGADESFAREVASPYAFDVRSRWTPVPIPGPPVSTRLRASGAAELAVLLEGALTAAGADRRELVRDPRFAEVLLDTCAVVPSGAAAGARVDIDPATGALTRVEVRVAAGDPLDETVLRSYAIGAAHMALGWVLTEGLAVAPDTGEVHDLTIRSFGVIRAKDTPRIDVTLLDDPGGPLASSSDAVFAAVAGATWNALAEADGARPERFPARETRASGRLRR